MTALYCEKFWMTVYIPTENEWPLNFFEKPVLKEERFCKEEQGGDKGTDVELNADTTNEGKSIDDVHNDKANDDCDLKDVHGRSFPFR